MTGHVYESSIFWALITGASKFTAFFGPWLLLLGCGIWAFRAKAWPGWLGLLGGTLAAGGHLARHTIPEVEWIALGGMQPTIDQNPFVFFFWMHGLDFGLVLVGVALAAQFVRRKTVA